SILFAFATFILGFVVFIRNYQSTINRRYALLATFTSTWIGSNSLSIITHNISQTEANKLFTMLITPSSLLTLFSFYLFSKVFPVSRKTTLTKIDKLLLLLTLLISATAFTDMNIKQEIINNNIVYTFGLIYPFYLVLMCLFAFYGLGILVFKAKKLKGLHKLQTKVVLWGLLFTVVPGMFTGVILPVLGYEELWNYSHLFTIFFILAVAYSILRYKVFDIRLVTLRLVAYLLSVLPFMIAIILLITVLPASLTGHYLDWREVWVVVFVTILSFPLLSQMRRLFDNLTRNLFYQGSYELDSILDEISKNLVLAGGVDDIVQRIGEIYKSSLGSSWFSVKLFARKDEVLKFGDKLNLKHRDLAYIQQHAKVARISSRLITSPLYYFFRKRDIEVAIVLHDTTKTIGILLLGPKKGGRLYTDTDKKLIEISAKNLAISLSNALKFEEISEFNETLKKSVKAATNELKVINKELTVLNETKNAFISAASHQLRPQLTSTEGFLMLLKNTAWKNLNTSEQNNLNYTVRGIKRMGHIIFGILEAAGNDKTHLKMHIKPIKFKRLIAEEIKLIKHQFPNCKIKLVEPETDSNITIRIDKDKFCEALYNLIHNAIEYSEKQKPIIVSYHQKNQSLEVVVTDKGIGISDIDSKKVFSKYFRSSPASQLRPSGTGVGLYVVKLFVEAHGGKVFVRSKVGVGSTFGFIIPIE
ncbi:MAG: ATP-binding protein, partial [Candidatus Saccharibacteria bacterium]|nr:ATP-binding protein [Candidatus Saccharibacteria bacterium]